MEDLNIVIGGAAGEAIQTIGEVLAEAVSALGYAVFSWQENESRIRGGLNSYSLRVSEKPVNAPLVKADILLALNRKAVDKYKRLLKPGGIVIAPVEREERTIALDLDHTAPAMARKRLAKVALLKKEVAPLETYGVGEAVQGKHKERFSSLWRRGWSRRIAGVRGYNILSRCCHRIHSENG